MVLSEYVVFFVNDLFQQQNYIIEIDNNNMCIVNAMMKIVEWKMLIIHCDKCKFA